jgi:sterol 3beta-glucosyltransferase
LRVVLTSFGTMGDVQPLLALAIEMREHGHRPVIGLSPNYRGRVEALDLEFASVGPEMLRSHFHDIITTQTNNTDMASQVAHYLGITMPMTPQIYQDLRTVCSGADVLISTPHQIAAHMVHEAIGIPYVTLHLSHFGLSGSKELRDVSAPIINSYRRAEGLSDLDDPLSADAISNQLALFAISSAILRKPKSWPPSYEVTGYFFLDEPTWQPDPALADFLSEGDPPIVVTFSSVVHDDPDSVTSLLLEAIEMSGRRAILMRGWSGLGERILPANVFACGVAPHAWLFERSACVVHHGGAGTTAAALRAGKTTVIIPHTLDQPIWAEYARALGTTSAVIPFAQLTSAVLSHAINDALDDPKYQKSADKVAAKIAVERGVSKARELIEQLIGTAEAR